MKSSDSEMMNPSIFSRMRGIKELFVQGIFQNKAFLKSSGYLALAGAVSSALAFGSMPILSRLYDPKDFGIFKALIAAVAALTPFTSFRYECTILLPQSRTRRLGCVQINLILSVIFSVLITIGCVLVHPVWLNGTLEALSFFLILFGTRLFLTFQYFASAERKFKVLGNREIQRSFVAHFLKIVGGIFGSSALGLLFGETVGTFYGIRKIARVAKFRWVRMRPAQYLATLRYYKKFPIFSSTSAFFTVLGQHFSKLALLSLIGASSFGNWSLAFSVLSAPLGIVGGALARTHLTDATELFRTDPKKLLRVYLKLVAGLALSFSPFAIVLFLGGQKFFAFAFGSNWIEAGQFSLLLIPYCWLQACIAPITNFNLIDRQELGLIWDIAFASLVFGSLFVGYWFKLDARSIVLLHSGAMAFSYALMFIMYIACLRNQAKLPIRRNSRDLTYD